MTAVERHAAALVAELRKWKARAENAEAELRTHHADGCAMDLPPPMTTVYPDGRLFRLMPWGVWLTKRNPDGSLYCNHGETENCPQDHDTEITYRLVPIEAES